MEQGGVLIRLKLDVKEAVELGDFLSSFTSLATEYDKYMRQSHPDMAPDAGLYVKEVRKGSLVADLVPWFATASFTLIPYMDQLNTVHDFIKGYGGMMLSVLNKERIEHASKTDLSRIVDQVAAVAKEKSPESNLEIMAIEVSGANGEKVSAVLKFNVSEARQIQENAYRQIGEMTEPSDADFERVSMCFTKTDTTAASTGKPSGEKVIIEAISPKKRSIIYASNLSEQRIKHEIREGEENVYKKIFVVDVNVEYIGGKPKAYRIKHVHDVILSDDD